MKIRIRVHQRSGLVSSRQLCWKVVWNSKTFLFCNINIVYLSKVVVRCRWSGTAELERWASVAAGQGHNPRWRWGLYPGRYRFRPRTHRWDVSVLLTHTVIISKLKSKQVFTCLETLFIVLITSLFLRAINTTISHYSVFRSPVIQQQHICSALCRMLSILQ